MNTSAFLLLLCLCSAGAAPCSGQRPSVEDAPKFARWLVSQGTWGYLGTLRQGDSAPFGYPVSYTDAATGVPYFYLSTLDPAGRNAAVNPQACFTLSERAVNGCSGADTQSPRCAKISLAGQLRKLPEDSWEKKRAEAALFAEHPQFTGFPKSNGTFAVYGLDIEDIFLVNKGAGSRDVTVPDYLGVGSEE